VNNNRALHQGVVVAVAVDPDGPLIGVMLLGPPGSGKSTLALALIEACPWRRTALVADDAFLISIRRGALIARAPEAIRSLLEVRGFGVAMVRSVMDVSLVAGFDLGKDSDRIAEPDRYLPGGKDARGIPVWRFRQSARSPARIRPILRSILSGQK